MDALNEKVRQLSGDDNKIFTEELGKLMKAAGLM
jgi:hypothetical protein